MRIDKGMIQDCLDNDSEYYTQTVADALENTDQATLDKAIEDLGREYDEDTEVRMVEDAKLAAKEVAAKIAGVHLSEVE